MARYTSLRSRLVGIVRIYDYYPLSSTVHTGIID